MIDLKCYGTEDSVIFTTKNLTKYIGLHHIKVNECLDCKNCQV